MLDSVVSGLCVPSVSRTVLSDGIDVSFTCDAAVARLRQGNFSQPQVGKSAPFEETATVCSSESTVCG